MAGRDARDPGEPVPAVPPDRDAVLVGQRIGQEPVCDPGSRRRHAGRGARRSGGRRPSQDLVLRHWRATATATTSSRNSLGQGFATGDPSSEDRSSRVGCQPGSGQTQRSCTGTLGRVSPRPAEPATAPICPVRIRAPRGLGVSVEGTRRCKGLVRLMSECTSFTVYQHHAEKARSTQIRGVSVSLAAAVETMVDHGRQR